ncbi:MAG: Hsp70 family protein [Kiritimatiellae bacterium]|nr:Hsp70 family protein [Kiritimatiellia bacterium]
MPINDLTLSGTRAGTGNEVFGIDLGTTYSAIAWLDQNGKPETLANIDGQPTTPSVVYFESPENIIVGETAKEMISQEPGRVVSFIKREMGNSEYSFTTPDGQSYSPIEISAYILKKLAQDAEAKTRSPVKNVIITCPAYFGTDEHRATREAGIHAGLNVLKILNEPTAAAYAYGIKEDEPQTIMVYDLGGGTFDVTIIRVDPEDKDTPIKVIVTGGDSTLGGKDWDAAFVDLLVRKWHEATGEETDILADELFNAALMATAEKNKKFLSTRKSVKISVNPPGGKSAQVEVTREEFDMATAGLLESTIVAAKATLGEAAKKEGVENFEFDTLLCVGGSSLMPQVSECLEREFGKKPRLEDPHECVAKGAAVFAGLHLVGGGGGRGDILSKSYGIVAGCRRPDGTTEDVVYNLLLKNQGIDIARHTRIFKTDVKDQRTIQFRVTESESGCWENAKAANPETGKEDEQERIEPMDEDVVKIIQSAEMQLPTGLDAGEPIEVTYYVDGDMVLNVMGVLQKTGEKIEIRCDGVGVKAPDKPMSKKILIQ